MKVKCLTKTLKKSLSQAELFAGKDLDLPVLSCVVLETKNNFLEISATNINTSFQANISVNVQEEGKVAVLADLFSRTISNIESDEVDLVLEGNSLKVISKQNELEINTMDFSDFPSILTPEQLESEEKIEIEIPTKDFVEGVNSVIYATSKSSIKPELASVFFNLQENILDFTATDGFRLAEKEFVFKDKYSDFKILLPNDSASILVKALSIEENSNTKLLYIDKNFFVESENMTISLRLTEGDYIDYKKVIPDGGETSIIFLKKDFLNLSKIVNIFTDDFNQVKFIVKDGVVKIETKNKYGKNLSKLEAVIDGEDIEMSFNLKNILDAFNSIHTDSVEFLFNNGRPLLIKGVGDKSFKYIVMPLSK